MKRIRWPWTLFYSPPGEISENGCWVIFHSCHMYAADTILGVVWLAITEYRHDKHLVG